MSALVTKLLCFLTFHDEWLDEYRVWDQPQMGDAIGRMRVKTIKREWECQHCGKRSTERERDSRQAKQGWLLRFGAAILLLIFLTWFMTATF